VSVSAEETCLALAHGLTYQLKGPYRLRHGVLAQDVSLMPGQHLTQLIVAGDVMGLAALAGADRSYSVRAVVGCLVERVDATAAGHRDLLEEALRQQIRRTHDITRLRCGAVAERVAFYLQLVSPPGRQHATSVLASLPTQREIARTIGASHETVCREWDRAVAIWQAQDVAHARLDPLPQLLAVG
jgi:CRP-like cAMP-binding protein